MQIELTLRALDDASYSARDLGFLLHKHPDHLHERDIAAGKVSIFYTQVDDALTTAVLYLDIDPVSLVRGKNQSNGLLTQYVNDRPYVANSFLSVAIARSFGQSLSGKSKERQDLADQALPLEAKVVPVAAAGGSDVIRSLFEPLGYRVVATPLGAEESTGLFEINLAGDVRLQDLLSHLYVLVPVLDNAKHYWIDDAEIDKLLEKGEGWLADHPAKDLIARRSLKHRPSLTAIALARLNESENLQEEVTERGAARVDVEEVLERPIRLHDLRLKTVVGVLMDHRVDSVLDLGCGEGKLLGRLIKDTKVGRIVGVDASEHTLEKAARRLRLNDAGDALRDRVALQMGSLTYADRRWQGFDAATLVEVIEHIDPPRLSALERSLFGEARPGLIIVTTPNREYNVLFEGMAEGSARHPDHRFEWTRAEFQAWSEAVAAEHGYTVAFRPLGPEDQEHGAPSQMALFERKGR